MMFDQITYMRCVGIAIMAALFLPVASLGQRQDVPARIALKEAAGAIDVLLTGRRGNVVHARLGENAPGSITYEVADIRRMAISLPQDVLRQVEAAVGAGNINEAVRRMRSVIQPIIPYLDLPVEGAVEPAFRYAELLRREGSWAAALSVYRALQNNPDSTIQQQAIGWMAYCHMRNKEAKEAGEMLARFSVEDPRHAGFVPGTLAGVLLKTSEGDDEAAIDLAARAASLSRIDHELYPETVYYAAGAYLRLSEKVAAPPDRKEVTLKKTTDEEIPMPSVSPEDCLEVASNLFTRITQLFPTSPFAADAARQIEIIKQKSEEKNIPVANESGAIP